MVNDYVKFKSDIYALTNIDLNLYKERQMKRRIDTLIARHSFRGYDDFTDAIREDSVLFDEFVNYLTINVSQFYRNPRQWQYLEEKIVPYLIDRFGNNIRIWSAACSTGDEPYSLVMLMSQFIPLKDIRIIATDIDEQVLTRAKEGLYRPESMECIPEEFKKRYFKETDSGLFRIDDGIKERVEFRKHNLLKDDYINECHMIVCRNVLIYFTDEAKTEIYNKFKASLRDDGVLFIGSTEQICNFRELGFESPRPFFYRKIQASGDALPRGSDLMG